AEQISQFSDEALSKALGLHSDGGRYKIAPLPEFEKIHEEMKKKSVTLRLLWEEYKLLHPTGYQYSQFCEHYRQWRQRLKLSLRQTHKAGEKLFVDYNEYLTF
ncbi:MAG: transposase, partial [SAR324 cluster bacterium]|nr:transposase [SAR324 cluster bacterium]